MASGERRAAERRKRKARGAQRRAGMASYGMWRARYWAVLGFDVVLVFLMIVAVGGLIEAKNVPAAVVFAALIAGAGTLFYFMVKAMARIQMPERRTPGAR